MSRQAPLSMGILQVRILEWVAMPSSRGPSQLRDQTQGTLIAGRLFTIWTTREAQKWMSVSISKCIKRLEWCTPSQSYHSRKGTWNEASGGFGWKYFWCISVLSLKKKMVSISNYITRILKKNIFVVWGIGWGEGREGFLHNCLFSGPFYRLHGWFYLGGMGLIFSLREWEKQLGVAKCPHA